MAEKSIFGGYDVRAIYPDQLDEQKALWVGIAFGRVLKAQGIRKCIVGRDNRPSSKPLAASFVDGLALYAGIDVRTIGEAPTSTVCFSLIRNAGYAGASVTASHNPVQYNGIKFFGDGGLPFSSGNLEILKAEYAIISNGGRPAKAAMPGKVSGSEYCQMHALYVAHAHKLARPVRIVVDCGNSVCSEVAIPMFAENGADVVQLYCTPDGNFPNHLPDPHKRENYAALSKRVRSEGADLGIMFDGDGDRAGFCDERGDIVDGDFIHILCLRDLLSRKEGATAVLDLRLSSAVYEEVGRLGGKAVMSKAGRMAIHELMDKLHADYGGEVTGHISFLENGGNDDAFWSAALISSIISRSDGHFSQIVASLPHYFSLPELRVPCADDKKSKIVEDVLDALKAKYPSQVNELDGVRLDLPDGWGLARVSNTEPQVTLRFEGKTQEGLRGIYSIFEAQMGSAGLELPKFETLGR